jgi:hypothetical protein
MLKQAFFINLVVAALVGPAMIFMLPSVPRKLELTLLSKVRSLDILGFILNIGVWVSWIILFTFGGIQWVWNDGRVIALFIIFGTLLLLFITSQYFSIFSTPSTRLIPVRLLKRRTIVLLHIINAAVATGLYVTIFYVPLLFQFSRGDNSLEAAVHILPFIVTGIISSAVSSVLIPRLGYYVPWYVMTGITSIIGGSLMLTVDLNTPAAHIYGYTIVIAIGIGSTLQLAYSVASVVVAREDVPSAIGFINMGQLGGATISLTITGQIFQTLAFRRVSMALAGLGFTDAQIRAAISGTQTGFLGTLSPSIREGVLAGIVYSIQRTYITVVLGGAITLICSAFLKREKLFLKPV